MEGRDGGRIVKKIKELNDYFVHNMLFYQIMKEYSESGRGGGLTSTFGTLTT